MADEPTSTNRLYRSRQERMLTGVAGGLAQYFNVDPVLVRLAFVVLTLTTGVFLLVYIVLAIVVPERPEGEEEPRVTSSVGGTRGRELAAYLLIGLGVLFLAANLGLFRGIRWDWIWPLLLIGIGVWVLVQRNRS